MASFADLKVGDDVIIRYAKAGNIKLGQVVTVRQNTIATDTGDVFSRQSGISMVGGNIYARLAERREIITPKLPDPEVTTLTAYNWQWLKESDPATFETIYELAVAVVAKKGGG